jgi:superfamily I DNA/RNA helicase
LAVCDVSADHQISENAVAFSTIHAFKGLESAVVIDIDIEQVDSEEARSLLYVGMSRARSLLVLMIREAARVLVEKRIREAMSEGLYS